MSTDTRTKYDTESKGPPSNSSSLSAGPVSFSFQVKRLFRELSSTIYAVLDVNWMTFAFSLGFSDDDVGESHTEPASKIYRVLLLNAAQHHGNTEEWWGKFLQQLTSFGNADLTRQIHSVYNKWKNKETTQQHDKVYPTLQSHVSYPSGFDQIENENSRHEEHDNDIVHPDRPEISMEINVVAEALDRVSNNSATAEITKWLRDGVPRIIQLERELKSQRELRRIFENETHDLKDQCGGQIRQIADLNLTIKQLEAEIAELKSCKQDDQLNEFDIVTRKEARDIKEEQKISAIEKQRAAAGSDVTPDAAKEEILQLKQDNATFKRQIDEIVKVNHSWDEHYRKMKIDLQQQIIDLRKEADNITGVRNDNEQLKTELATLQREMDQTQDDKDTLLIQAKERIDRTEKDNTDKRKELDVLRRKFEKVQGYARSLTNQRKEAEEEIARLNEALAQKMATPPAKEYRSAELQQNVKCPPEDQPPIDDSMSASMAALLANSLEVPKKGVASMSEQELRDELELLRQQTDVYRSDFNHERQDRQRVMGELDETKKELLRYQHDLKKRSPKATSTATSKEQQLLDDELYAQRLQRLENGPTKRPTPLYRKTAPQQMGHQPRYQAQQPQLPHRRHQPQMYYTVEDVNNLQYPQKPGLVPHGGGGQGGHAPRYYYEGPPYGRNYAANDMLIDGSDGIDGGDIEIDGAPEIAHPPQGSVENAAEDMSCPRCERGFTDDGEYRQHMDRCLVD